MIREWLRVLVRLFHALGSLVKGRALSLRSLQRFNGRLMGPNFMLTKRRPRWAKLARRGWRPVLRGRGSRTPLSGELTQLGSGSKFPDQPRWIKQELDLSMIDGCLDVDEAVRLCFRRPVRSSDRVRCLSVERLREAGYRLQRTPLPTNPAHVSVTAPVRGSALEKHQEWWWAPERVTLDKVCEA